MTSSVQQSIFASGMQSPEGPSFDRSGDLYFVDWDAKDIRRNIHVTIM